MGITKIANQNRKLKAAEFFESWAVSCLSQAMRLETAIKEDKSRDTPDVRETITNLKRNANRYVKSAKEIRDAHDRRKQVGAA